MNNIDILQKTKELLGDYLLLCQNSGISIPDFMAARQEAIYELQVMEKYNALPHPHLSQFPSEIDKKNEIASFDPFNQPEYKQQSHSPDVGRSDADRSSPTPKDHDADPFPHASPSGENKSKENKQELTPNDDPFFRLINKIQD